MVTYESFRKVISRMENTGLLKCVSKGIYENPNGTDQDYLIKSLVKNENGVKYFCDLWHVWQISSLFNSNKAIHMI